MIKTPNPWNFHNTEKTLVSPDKLSKLVYYDLNEIAMGAPLGGLCFLEINDIKIKIHDWFGGPPVWEQNGQFAAIPIWTRSISKGTAQQIGIVDVKHLELKIFLKTFRVLDLRSFDKTIVYGFDSPIHNTKPISFDTEKEKIESIIQLTEELLS